MLDRRNAVACIAALSLGFAASCGSGTDISATPGDSTQADEASAVETTTAASADEDTAAETDPPATEPAPSVEWSGPNFVDVAEARMAELEPPIGQLYSAAAVAPVFEMPSDFPDLAGTITGIFNVWDVDASDGEISQERIVGTDTVSDMEGLRAHGAEFVENESAPWKLESISDGGNNFGALFSSQAESNLGQWLVLRAYQDPEAGDPNFLWILEVEPTEIVAPSWAESLPIPEGGQLGGFREGIGVVEDFGTLAENGFLDISMTYPIEALPELEAFFSSDVLTQAGFNYEDTPFNNQSVRIDLSIGDWSGRVSVWEGSYGDTTYLGVTWTLARPVG